MKNIITQFATATVAVCGSFFALSATAQDVDWSKVTFGKTITATVEQYPQTDWSHSIINFSAQEIADGLGMTVEDLYNEDLKTMVYAKDTINGGTYVNSYSTSIPPGFWFDKNGIPGAFSSNAYIFMDAGQWDTANESLSYWVGQINTGCEPRDTPYTIDMYLVKGDKAVTIRTELTVLKKETIENIIDWNNLTDVGDFYMKLSQTPRTDWSGDIASISGADLAKAFGIPEETLYQFDLTTMAYTDDPENEGGYTNAYNTSGHPGFWFDMNGKKGSQSENNFYVDAGQWNENNGTFTFKIGQVGSGMPLSDGFPYKATVYLILGNMKANIHIELNILEEAEFYIDWENLTKVATFTKEVTQYPRFDWSSDREGFDLTEVAEALGFASAEEMATIPLSKMVYAQSISSSNDLSNSYTTSVAPGFWFDRLGHTCYYNETDSYIFLDAGQVSLENNTISFLIGQYMTGCALTPEGDPNKLSVYLLHGDKQVELQYQLSIVEKPDFDPADLVEVAQFDMNVGIDPEKLEEDILIPLPKDEILSALETTEEELSTNIHVFAIDKNNKPNLTAWDNLYGYWFTADGSISNYDDENSVLAVRYANTEDPEPDFDNLHIYAFSVPSPETTLPTTICIANNEKMVTLHIHFSDATGIESCSAVKAVPQQVFDINGRKMNTTVKNLKKGIYVIDGEKKMIQ